MYYFSTHTLRFHRRWASRGGWAVTEDFMKAGKVSRALPLNCVSRGGWSGRQGQELQLPEIGGRVCSKDTNRSF